MSVVIEMPLGLVTAADLDGEVYHIPPGKYHVLITGVEKSKPEDTKEFLRIRYEILAGASDGNQGAKMSEKFFLSAAALKRLCILGFRLGLFADADFGRPKLIDWSVMVGRDLIVECVDNTYVSKKNGEEQVSTQWGYAGFWAADDARVKTVPRDDAARARRINEMINAEAAALGLGEGGPKAAAAAAANEDAF